MKKKYNKKKEAHTQPQTHIDALKLVQIHQQPYYI